MRPVGRTGGFGKIINGQKNIFCPTNTQKPPLVTGFDWLSVPCQEGDYFFNTFFNKVDNGSHWQETLGEPTEGGGVRAGSFKYPKYLLLLPTRHHLMRKHRHCCRCSYRDVVPDQSDREPFAAVHPGLRRPAAALPGVPRTT